MKTTRLNAIPTAGFRNCILTARVSVLFLLSSLFAPVSTASAQPVLFDFDNAPQYTSLPITLTAGGITAHFFASSSPGYSIQAANVLGFTPPGFAGNIIYPNSIYLTDLLVGFDQTLTDFSIMYSCQELGCDDAATMRVTAFMNGSYVGTNTRTATVPGTWPVDTLSCIFPQGFDSVVVHYDSHPPLCQDYGVIYMADNMVVTPLGATGITGPKISVEGSIFPNPVAQSATLSLSLLQSETIRVTTYDINGRPVKILFDGSLNAGQHELSLQINDGSVQTGIYFLNISSGSFSRFYKLVLVN